VPFAGLGGERRQHQAIGQDAVAGEFGDLAASRAACGSAPIYRGIDPLL
jgi:hypothetical protein